MIYCGQGTVNNEHGHAFEVMKEKIIYLERYICGTLRKNPPSVLATKLKKDDFVWKKRDKYVC